ncbi:threonine synthase [Dactylosporangium darangshiense]|uniref:Threonine synthase n=1 Tax=Dactylosporangium darangshiense TaxID=579108 RepID=A0ABP8DD18_9ACTN
MTYTGVLQCRRCGTERPDTDPYAPCAPCLAEGVHANPFPVYRLTGADWHRDPARPGVFGWQHLLPLRPGTAPVSLGEGGTPLLPLTRTASRLGLQRLYLKDESRNPTWSYKDRLIAVAVARAVQDGAETVAVASTGNHGAAAAAYAGAAGLRCVVLTLESVPLTMKVLMQSYGAHVVALRQAPDRWKVLAEGVRARGWVPLSGYLSPPAGSNPFGVDGYKTIAYEIVASLGTAPDVLVAPAAYGDGLAGIRRGFEDLVELGVVPRVPRLVAAEPFGPYADALTHGFRPGATVPAGPTVAFSVGTPVATYQGYAALSGGAAATATDEEIMASQLRLAREEGVYLEASSVLPVAVLGKLVAGGTVGPDDTVVLLGTSTGLKDIGATAALLPAVPVIEPSLESLDATLRQGS